MLSPVIACCKTCIYITSRLSLLLHKNIIIVPLLVALSFVFAVSCIVSFKLLIVTS